MSKPVVLCILDGVGISNEKSHNAVVRAKMPFFHSLLKKYPNTKLNASGASVGLPIGTMGNSEVGHITIGAGRIVNQFLRRFQIEAKKITENKKLNDFIKFLKKSGGTANIIGLCSDGRVHSNLEDGMFIAKIIRDSGIPVKWHVIADGRDVPPTSVKKYVSKILREFGPDSIATISGRYYAMDRNNNWERVQLSFDAITNCKSEFISRNVNAAIAEAYARGETDEFIKPTLITNKQKPITSKDGILFFNYRSDRARQILKALMFPEIPEIKRPNGYTQPKALCFSQYGEGLDEFCPTLLPDVPVKNTFGDVAAAAGISQLRIAETEKYNHVTYFFDSERTLDFPHEEKVLIPSPKVATFDLKPEMSAPEITEALLPKLKKFDVIILNYANGDMVGHTGIEKATIKAMETLDAQLAKLIPSILKLNGTVLITADHGNAEKMWNTKTNSPWTAHTTNPVPLIIISNEKHIIKQKNGGLSDIAPTMLKILGIKQPKDMTGKSLI